MHGKYTSYCRVTSEKLQTGDVEISLYAFAT